MDFIIVRYLHFLGIVILIAMLALENFLFHPTVQKAQLKKLVTIDAVYGVSAVLILVTGLMMWLSLGKPAEFYTKNLFFHLKLSLFILVAVLSLYPTFVLLKGFFTKQEILLIKPLMFWVKRLELLIVLFIPLCAVLMVYAK